MIRLYLSTLLILGTALAGPTFAREVVPAPPVGEGVNVLAADHAVPYTGKPNSADPGTFRRPIPDIPALLKENLEGRTDYDDIGGDDITILLDEPLGLCDIDITSNGHIYVAVDHSTLAGSSAIEVFRSLDRGRTWQPWGEFLPNGPNFLVGNPDILIAEGDVDRCFLAYRHTVPGDVVVAYSPLSSPTGNWTEVVVLPGNGHSYFHPAIATDAANFGYYFLYLAAGGQDGNGTDIWFARSTNQGDSWETPYKIGSIAFADRGYYWPKISYGFDGHIHVAWELFSTEGAVESAIRYRTVPLYANGGLDSWDTIKAITTTDGIQDIRPLIAASQSSHDVVLNYGRGYYHEDDFIYEPPIILHSTDEGATWGPPVEVYPAMYDRRTLEQNPADGTWVMGGGWMREPALQRTLTADPTDWSDPLVFADHDYPGWIADGKPVALDPAHNYRAAVVWTNPGGGSQEGLYFDAEWRSDPGVPNLEPGFPLGLWASPVSPPAVVDVDGDGDLEIVFSDALNQIQVINHDGTSPPGWPRDVGVALADGPVAVGDLNDDGHVILTVGGTDGKAYAYDHEGNLLPGWPSAITPPGHHIYCSIGAVGGPYHRSIVCAGANYITLRSHHGVAPPGTIGWSIGGGGTFESPAVMGDIDNDGVTEIVGGLGTRVFAFKKGVSPVDWVVTIGAALSDALTMGDLDLDGDLEILCPTTAGVLYALDHNGTQLGGGFPYDTGNTGPLTSAAIAQFRGPLEPELAFAHQDWTVFALYGDGSLVEGYPENTTDFWFIYGAPVMGPVNLPPTDVVVGDRGNQGWAWSYTGNLLGDWPYDMQNKVNWSPAMGDIDLDGNIELVFLTETQVFVIDVNADPTGANLTWPMYGHDPRRTGCADCAEDLVTPVDLGDPEGAITRVSFAGASPNPVSTGTQFSFAVPLRSAVSLDILDLRGARVYTVYREETEAGPQVVTWNGCDGSGRPLASGAYFARLRVRGPGLDEVMTRKLMVVK